MKNIFNLIATATTTIKNKKGGFMAYAILRIQKTKRTAIASKNSHNMRLRKTENADEDRREQNEVLIGSGNLKVDLKKRLTETDCSVRNSTTVVAQELVLTASSDFFYNDKNELERGKLNLWKKQQMKYLNEKFGENCINAVLHLDEQTPHIHAFVTPIVFNEKKQKNELNNKNFFLSDYKKAQNDYYSYNQYLGLKRGVESELTNSTNKTLKDYNKETKRTFKTIEDKTARARKENKIDLLTEQTEKILFIEKEKKYSASEVNKILTETNKKLLKQNEFLIKSNELLKNLNRNLENKDQENERRNKEKARQIVYYNSQISEYENKLKYVYKLEPSWMNVLKSQEYIDFKREQEKLNKAPKLNKNFSKVKEKENIEQKPEMPKMTKPINKEPEEENRTVSMPHFSDSSNHNIINDNNSRKFKR